MRIIGNVERAVYIKVNLLVNAEITASQLATKPDGRCDDSIELSARLEGSTCNDSVW